MQYHHVECVVMKTTFNFEMPVINAFFVVHKVIIHRHKMYILQEICSICHAVKFQQANIKTDGVRRNY